MTEREKKSREKKIARRARSVTVLTTIVGKTILYHNLQSCSFKSPLLCGARMNSNETQLNQMLSQVI